MTDETIVAVYDTPAHADAAVRDLESINVPREAITRHSGSSTTGNPGSTEPPREKGFWASLFGGDPGPDEEVYNRSVAGGSSVVMVKVPDQHVQRVTDVLERHNPVDIDERAAGYGIGMGGTSTTTSTTSAAGMPADGTTMGGTTRGTSAPGLASSGGTGSGMTGTTGSGMADTRSGMSTTGASTSTTPRTGEEVLPLAEEELTVGKRLVNRGTTRIRRFVVETPVEEAVNLHSEHVSVERRPASGSANVANPEFTDRTVEFTETDEEAVVAKTAHVKEEVVINKEATDRTETVRDTVRREDVEITKDGSTTTGTTTTGTTTTGTTTPGGSTAGTDATTDRSVDPTRPRI
jgi:uncharacterized protein (TIGR02271 family)